MLRNNLGERGRAGREIIWSQMKCSDRLLIIVDQSPVSINIFKNQVTAASALGWDHHDKYSWKQMLIEIVLLRSLLKSVKGNILYTQVQCVYSNVKSVALHAGGLLQMSPPWNSSCRIFLTSVNVGIQSSMDPAPHYCMWCKSSKLLQNRSWCGRGDTWKLPDKHNEPHSRCSLHIQQCIYIAYTALFFSSSLYGCF